MRSISQEQPVEGSSRRSSRARRGGRYALVDEHRALWLCAGRAGATDAWLDEQLNRFEVHALLRAAWKARGAALFELESRREATKEA